MSLAAAGSAATPITAGRRIVTNQIEAALFDGRSDGTSFPTARPRSVCLASVDAAKGPELAFSDLRQCRVLRTPVSGGAFSFETECKATSSDDLIVTRSAGRYAADSYVGTSTSMQRRAGLRTEMRSPMEAKRVGNCSAGK
ncbi:DUF3617 family protein [Sphingomonas gellani]|uniref:DUF3617 domain-containing protein n=1 Tax=Sphingomonas gellani TaxID=1166340 RepID=UPI000B816CF1